MNITQESEAQGLMKLLEDIEYLQDNKPDGRKKKEYEKWKKTLEEKMKEYNKMCGIRAFTTKIA